MARRDDESCLFLSEKGQRKVGWGESWKHKSCCGPCRDKLGRGEDAKRCRAC